jgi:hypothetical protein
MVRVAIQLIRFSKALSHILIIYPATSVPSPKIILLAQNIVTIQK